MILKVTTFIYKWLKVLFIVVIISFTTGVLGQQNHNDVYRKKIITFFYSHRDSSYYFINKLKKSHLNDHDTIKAKDFNNFSIYFLFSNQKDSAIYFLNRSLKLSSKKNRPKTVVSLAVLYKKTGDYRKAYAICDSLVKLNSTDTQLKGIAYFEMASINSLKQNFYDCKTNFLKAITFSEKAKDSLTLYNAKINFANFYYKNKLPELALPLYNESKKHYKNKNARYYTIAAINSASCNKQLKDIDAALLDLKSINENTLKDIDDDWILASYYNTKALLLTQVDIKDKSIDSLYRLSLDYAKNLMRNEFLEYYNNYLDYAVALKETEKVKNSLKNYKIDSVYYTANLINKVEFLSILNRTEIKQDFKDIYKVDFVKLKDSLNAMTTFTMKEELLSKISRLENVTKEKENVQGKYKIFIYLVFLLIGTMLFLVIKYQRYIKSIIFTSKKTILKYKTVNLDLKKDLIDVYLTETINQKELTKEDHEISSPAGSQKHIPGYWIKFKDKLKSLDPDFVEKMKNKHTNLTTSELDLCCFIRLNMSNNEMAELFQIEYKSLIKKKQRLKNKLLIDKNSTLEEYVFSL